MFLSIVIVYLASLYIPMYSFINLCDKVSLIDLIMRHVMSIFFLGVIYIKATYNTYNTPNKSVCNSLYCICQTYVLI